MIELPEVARVPLLDEILGSDDLRPMFQPIVRLDGAPSIFGFEALARFRSPNPILDPEFLFLYAGRKNRICELDAACLRRSLLHGAQLPKEAALFVNLHPAMFSEPQRWMDLVESAIEGGLDPARLILEVTEQGSVDEPRVTSAVFDRIHRLGIRLALDDVGIAYSHLALIDRIRPAFVKISQHFGTGFEADATKLKLVRNIASLARDFGCSVVLEGIETRATAEAAARVGIEYGQGFHFARPADASAFAGS